MASRIDTGVTGGAPNLLGSLTAAARPLPEDADWQAFGVSHVPENCGAAWPWQHCTDGVANDKPLNPAVPPASFEPFLAEYNAQCEGMAFDLDGLVRKAENGLKVRSSFVLAQVLSSSTPDGQPNANPNLPELAQPVSSSPENLACAVAALIDAATISGVVGELFFHAPAWTLPMWLKDGLIEAVGNVYKMGPHTVVLDQGYIGEEPTGEAASSAPESAWVYVTGPVEYAAGPVQTMADTTRGMEVRQNVANAIAAQLMIYRFDPCGVHAALVPVCAAAAP